MKLIARRLIRALGYFSNLAMSDLLNIITSVDFEDYGSLQLLEVWRRDGNIYLLLDVVADEDPDLPRKIQVTCRSPRENNLSAGHYDDFSISQDHVLLWHYTKPHISISFYGKAQDPLSVVGALYERHVDLVEDWIPFHKYLNSEVRLAELIAGSFGMLADGVEPLVLAYEEVMQRYGFSTSHHESRPPVYWDGERWVEENAALSVMLLDKCFVIAEAFEASAI
jgi:hypothetical protein